MFELTDETCTITDLRTRSHVLYRLRATEDIPELGVRKGDEGGFVEVPPVGMSWVGRGSHVWACRIIDSVVRGDCQVSHSTVVSSHIVDSNLYQADVVNSTLEGCQLTHASVKNVSPHTASASGMTITGDR